MYCQFCGEDIDLYNISCTQRMGMEVDGEGGDTIEAHRLVTTATCGRCGTMNHTEQVTYEEDSLILYDDYTEERHTGPLY